MVGDTADNPQTQKESPRALSEALGLLARGAAQGHPWRVVAGGDPPEGAARLLDLSQVGSLHVMTQWAGGLSLGPLLTPQELRRSDLIEELAPLLRAWAEASRAGWLGGAVEVADAATRAVLTAWGGSVILASREGAREVTWASLFEATGARRPEELFLRICVPSRPWSWGALKVCGQSAAAAWVDRGELAVAVAEPGQQRRLRGLELVLMRRMTREAGSVIDVEGLTGDYRLHGDTAEAVRAVLRRLASRLTTV
jgi:CO/xanthine dehydrogenase FAD-binding subunit